jgi:hypothetical protein
MQSPDEFLAWAEAEIADLSSAAYKKLRRDRWYIRIVFWALILGLFGYLAGGFFGQYDPGKAPMVALFVVMIAGVFHKSGIADRDAARARMLAWSVRSRVSIQLGMGAVAPQDDYDLTPFRAVGLLPPGGHVRSWNKSESGPAGVQVEVAEVDFITDIRQTLVARLTLPRPRTNTITLWRHMARPDQQADPRQDSTPPQLDEAAGEFLADLPEALRKAGYYGLIQAGEKCVVGDAVEAWLLGLAAKSFCRLHIGRREILLAMPFAQEPLEVDYERFNKTPMEVAVPYYVRLRSVLALAAAASADANR